MSVSSMFGPSFERYRTMSWGDISSDDDDDFTPVKDDNNDSSDGEMDEGELHTELEELKAEDEAAQQIDFNAAQTSWFQLTNSIVPPSSSAPSPAPFDPELDSSRHGVPLMFKSLFTAAQSPAATPVGSPKKHEPKKSPWANRLRSPLREKGTPGHRPKRSPAHLKRPLGLDSPDYETTAAQPVVKRRKLANETASPMSLQQDLVTDLSSPQPTSQSSDSALRQNGRPMQPVTPMDDRRESQRQKQIDMGKATIGYRRYLKLMPKHMRSKMDPKTPNKRKSCSKRSWDGQMRVWRRALHKFDPDVSKPLCDTAWPNMSTPSPTTTKPQARGRKKVRGTRRCPTSQGKPWNKNTPDNNIRMTRSRSKHSPGPFRSL